MGQLSCRATNPRSASSNGHAPIKTGLGFQRVHYLGMTLPAPGHQQPSPQAVQKPLRRSKTTGDFRNTASVRSSRSMSVTEPRRSASPASSASG